MEQNILSNEDIKEVNKQKDVEDYIIYAQNTLERYKQVRHLAENNNITPEQINRALADYMSTLSELIRMYEQIKLEYNNEKEDFQIWFDEKYIQIKEELNPVSLAGTKWSSTKEIESYVRVRYKEEYQERKRALNLLEIKVATLRRVNDAYKNFSMLLNTMSKNMQTELSVLTLENRMNREVKENTNNRRQPKE
jgi:DNA-binding phage protein